MIFTHSCSLSSTHRSQLLTLLIRRPDLEKSMATTTPANLSARKAPAKKTMTPAQKKAAEKRVADARKALAAAIAAAKG